MTTDTLPTLYTCPGEEHSIPRSVHLSRLAAFYPKCRDCQHRADTGNLPQQTLERLQSTECRIERPSLFAAEGVRGIYLNELTRSKASHLAGALASLLWDRTPLIGRVSEEEPIKRNVKRSGPIVVVGYDERPSSPDIVTGVTTGLKRMGCQIIDIGLSTRPVFCFAVDHLQAAAGVFVTGAGCDPSWTGLDVVGQRVQPFSKGNGLDELEARYRAGYSRPTRQSGSLRLFQAAIPYEAGLWKHFHALRPLKVCCACPVLLLRSLLSRLFGKLPCELELVAIPNRLRQVDDPKDPDVVRLGEAVRKNDAHLGILIDDDGQTCGFVDERGKLIGSMDVTQLIAEELLSEHPEETIVVESPVDGDFNHAIKSVGSQCITTGTTMAELSNSMREQNAIFGGGQSSRYWFREAYPACDAILVIAKLLQALSRSDAKFSDVVSANDVPEKSA